MTPKPHEPPSGTRWLSHGERLQEGDEYWNARDGKFLATFKFHHILDDYDLLVGYIHKI